MQSYAFFVIWWEFFFLSPKSFNVSKLFISNIGRNIAKVHIVHQHSSLSHMAQKAAIDSGLLQFQQEEIILHLRQRHHKPACVLAKKERVQADFPTGKNVKTKLILGLPLFCHRPTTLHQRGKKSALGDWALRCDDPAVKQAAQDEFQILYILVK